MDPLCAIPHDGKSKMSSLADPMVGYARKAKHKAKAKLLAVFQPHAVLNSVILTLRQFEKAAEYVPAPGLKVAVGGVLVVLEKLQVNNTFHAVRVGVLVVDILDQKAKQNYEDFVELNHYLRRLNGVMEPLRGVNPFDVPWALRDRINRLAKYANSSFFS